MTNELRAFLAIAEAVIEAIEAAPLGAPAGHLYAALMGIMDLERFEQFMEMLVSAGRVRREGLLYFPQRRAS